MSVSLVYHHVVEPAERGTVEVVWSCIGRLWNYIKHKYKYKEA